jgi:hypothetical protein
LLRQDSQSEFATSTKSPVNSRLFGGAKASRQGAPPTSLQPTPPPLPPPPTSAERPKTVGEYLKQLRETEEGFDKDDDVSSYSSDFEFGDDRNDENAAQKASKTIDKPELRPEEMVLGQSPQTAPTNNKFDPGVSTTTPPLSGLIEAAVEVPPHLPNTLGSEEAEAFAPAPATALMARILENDDPQPASLVKPNSTKLRQGFIKDFVVKKG